MTTDPNIGRLLANRYQLVELVGKGAMGRVYRAEDTLLGGVIAVKFLAQTLLNPKMSERFKAEARTCAQLGQRSIHIVRVMDYGLSQDDIPFYVMEYLQGESLNEIVSGQQLPLLRFLNLTRQICLGLQCAHQGIRINGRNCPIIHRDIKPSNIVVSQDSSLGELAKILDFGISKLIQADSGQTSSYMGTLAYSSPEQMEGRELDARSDIYSMGVMMFEMLTGKMPLYAETHSFGSWYKAHHYMPPRTIAEANPGLKLPKALETLVMSCLAKAPAERPQSIEQVLKSLEHLEQRYSGNLDFGRRIGEKLPATPVQPESESVFDNGNHHRIQWPKDKPTAQIVFAQPVSTHQGDAPALWVMLPKQEIEILQINQFYNRIYRNFLCAMAPYPMLLWLTAVHNTRRPREQGPRWLRCYLDLKTKQGQVMTRLLGTKGQYQVLLFALENPTHCAHVMTISFPESQCSLLQRWAIESQTLRSVGEPNMSKTLLQAEFGKIKPKIEADLQID